MCQSRFQSIDILFHFIKLSWDKSPLTYGYLPTHSWHGPLVSQPCQVFVGGPIPVGPSVTSRCQTRSSDRWSKGASLRKHTFWGERTSHWKNAVSISLTWLIWQIQKSVESTMHQDEDQISGLFNHILPSYHLCFCLLCFCQWERFEWFQKAIFFISYFANSE